MEFRQGPTHGAPGGQDDHIGRRQYAVGGNAGGQNNLLPVENRDRVLLVNRDNLLLEDNNHHCLP